jgi:hypothetical protein
MKGCGGGGGDEREHIHISGDSSPICKRHIESMLKGIKSYLCLVQTGHVDIEEFVEGKGRDTQTNNIVWNMERIHYDHFVPYAKSYADSTFILILHHIH